VQVCTHYGRAAERLPQQMVDTFLDDVLLLAGDADLRYNQVCVLSSDKHGMLVIH